MTGSSGIAGPLKVGGIECDLPGIASSSIFVLARPAEPAATVRVSFLPKAVIVAVVTGSGSKYRSRTFVGAGMTSFDAATGAHVNSPLVEAKQAGSSGGSLGTVSSISGIVDCGSQTSGHTTITLTGQTATGALSHSVIHPVKVTCTALAAGASVNIIGITRAGSSTVEVVIGVQSTAFTVSISAKGSKPQSFSSSTGTATASAHGAHIDGAVSEAATSHTLQVSGDATCGK